LTVVALQLKGSWDSSIDNIEQEGVLGLHRISNNSAGAIQRKALLLPDAFNSFFGFSGSLRFGFKASAQLLRTHHLHSKSGFQRLQGNLNP
jgi:hypothetical protein